MFTVAFPQSWYYGFPVAFSQSWYYEILLAFLQNIYYHIFARTYYAKKGRVFTWKFARVFGKSLTTEICSHYCTVTIL